MKNEMIKLRFEIICYNLHDDSLKPTEIHLFYRKSYPSSNNFLKVVEGLMEQFNPNSDTDATFCLPDIYKILWNEHFTDAFLQEMLDKLDTNDYAKLNVPLKMLHKQFNLEDKTIKVIISSGDKAENLKFFFRIGEDYTECPYIYCKYSGIEKKIDLNKIEFVDCPFKYSIISHQALKIVNKHRSQLMNYWDKIIATGENIEFDFDI